MRARRADEVAYHLGRALQLTNILRDLAEDAARGRLYLPREYLLEAGVLLAPQAALASASLPAVCERVAGEAHAHFAAARAAMKRCAPAAMRPARIMAATYAAVLGALERRGWSRPAEAVRVPGWRKLLIAARYAVT